MKKSELKKFTNVKDSSLKDVVGGHSRAYHDGWVAGRVANIVGTAASIGLGIASLCMATKNNHNN